MRANMTCANGSQAPCLPLDSGTDHFRAYRRPEREGCTQAARSLHHEEAGWDGNDGAVLPPIRGGPGWGVARRAEIAAGQSRSRCAELLQEAADSLGHFLR